MWGSPPSPLHKSKTTAPSEQTTTILIQQGELRPSIPARDTFLVSQAVGQGPRLQVTVTAPIVRISLNHEPRSGTGLQLWGESCFVWGQISTDFSDNDNDTIMWGRISEHHQGSTRGADTRTARGRTPHRQPPMRHRVAASQTSKAFTTPPRHSTKGVLDQISVSSTTSRPTRLLNCQPTELPIRQAASWARALRRPLRSPGPIQP